MIGMNRWSGTGRLVADPELKYIPGTEEATCNVRIAITRPYKNKKTEQYDSDFIDVVFWRKSAETIVNKFSKGDVIGVEGRLKSFSYPDKNHPEITHYRVQVVADLFSDLGQKKNGGKVRFAEEMSGAYPIVDDRDIPL